LTGASIPSAVGKAEAWLVDAALPLWLTMGVDRRHGGFEESLTLAGERIPEQNKRVRVQARQIYAASHAAALGLHSDALAAARHGFEFLTAKAWHPEGGWVHLLSATGEVRDAKRDTYDHAFVLLALAWYYRASGDNSALNWIERTVAALDNRLADGTGAFFESLPRAAPRRQNPHMHCFEAMLALFEATGESSFAARARQIHTLVCERFFDRTHGALREFYGEDWKPLTGVEGMIVEPGHHCEWVWLLDKFETLTAIDTGALRRALLDFAFAHGKHAETGLLIDQVSVKGQQLLTSQRLWPQTEAVKALLTLVERGETLAWAGVDGFTTGLLARYLRTEPPGLWHDHFDASGGLLSKFVPASSLYHLFVAFTELTRVARSASTRD
jgi:mannose/cellobiose epimerase-like protein (N-acyl-D-glucosamine 2-epimerase family)